MTSATVEPYQETSLNFPYLVGTTDVNLVLDWCRVDIEAELVDFWVLVVNSAITKTVGATNVTNQS